MLPPSGAAESAVLEATAGSDTATLHDVAIGELLLCGGQSNMVRIPLAISMHTPHNYRVVMLMVVVCMYGDRCRASECVRQNRGLRQRNRRSTPCRHSAP